MADIYGQLIKSQFENLTADPGTQPTGLAWLRTDTTPPALKFYDGATLQTLASLAAAQTLTNKTINGASNTLTVRLANDVSGTLPVANGGTGVTSSTGTVAVVLSTSPTLVTPLLGVPTSGTLTNCTGLPLTTGVTGTLPETNGGTNQSTYTLGDLLYASAANTLSKLAGNTTATNKLLAQTGTGSVSAAPGWVTLVAGDIPSLAASKITSGTLAVAQGGTNLASGTSGGVLYYSASGTLASSGALTASAIVLGGGAGSTPTSLALGTANQVLGMINAATSNEYKTLAVGTSGTDFAIAHTAGTVTFNLPDASATARGPMTTGTQTIAGNKTFTGTTTIFGSGSGTNVVACNAGASSLCRYNFNQNGVTIQQWELSTGGDLSLNKDGGSTTVFLKANYTGTYIEFPSGETTFTANFNTGLSTATNNFTVTARKFGKTVVLTFPECKATATATTNTWSTSGTPIASGFRPAAQSVFACCIENNNANVYTEGGFLIVNTDGSLQVVRATSWVSTTAACGFNSISVCFAVAS